MQRVNWSFYIWCALCWVLMQPCTLQAWVHTCRSSNFLKGHSCPPISPLHILSTYGLRLNLQYTVQMLAGKYQLVCNTSGTFPHDNSIASHGWYQPLHFLCFLLEMVHVPTMIHTWHMNFSCNTVYFTCGHQLLVNHYQENTTRNTQTDRVVADREAERDTESIEQ